MILILKFTFHEYYLLPFGTCNFTESALLPKP